MIPQLLMFAIYCITFTVHATRHGEDYDLEYNVWGRLLAIAISATILYYGGFWDVMI